MTPLSVRNVRLARAGLVLAAVGAVMMVANYFASAIPVKLGMVPHTELMDVAVHAGAGIMIFGLFLLCIGRPAIVLPALGHPLVLVVLAIAVWSALLAPFADFPLASFVGAPFSYDGVSMYAQLALLMAAAMVLRRFRLGAWVAGIGVGVGVLVPALVAAGLSGFGFLREYCSFFAPAAAALMIASCRRLPPRNAAALGLAAGLPALILSNSNTLWGASIVALCLFAGLAWLRRGAVPASRARHHRLAALLPPLALVAGTLGMAVLGAILDKPRPVVFSPTARFYLDRIALDVIGDRPLSLLTGHGWGQSSEIILAHLNASGAIIWDRSWDAIVRRYRDFHNIGIEAVIAAGIPALLGILAMMAMVPLYARRGLLLVATGFMTAVATMMAAWFQATATIPLVALTTGWLVRPVYLDGWLRRVRRARIVWASALLVCAMASFAAAGWLTIHGLAVRHAYYAETTAPDPALACENIPLDLDRGSFALGYDFILSFNEVFADVKAGKPVSAERLARMERLLCAVGRAAGQTRSTDLLIAPLLFRGSLMFEPGLDALRDRYADIFPTWGRAVDRFLVRAPGRTDMAWTYLAWRVERGDYAAVMAFARRLLARDPDDPVGLWFAGLVMVKTPDQATRESGIGFLRQSLAAGVERFAPIPAPLRAEIMGGKS